MKPLRVLQIIHGFAVEGPLGGIERFAIELAQALDRQQVEPIVCGMWDYHTAYEGEWVAHLRDQGIEAFVTAPWSEESPYRAFLRAWQGARRHLVGQKVDLIHSHCQFGDGLALLLQRQLGAQALLRTVHNEREWGRRPFRRLFLTGFLYPLRFQAELGVAQQVVDNLDRRPVARLLRRRAIKAYNSLNFARFDDVQVDRALKRATLGVPVSASLVGSVGRLTEQKGYGLLLEAAVQVLQHKPETYFLIVGTGELEQELQAKAVQLGIAERVIFTGARRDVEEILPVLDLFISSSLWEGLPTVLLESMAARVPVVATRVSGNRELLQDGVTGRLVPPADPAALARAIAELLAISPAQRSLMVERAYHFARTNFSIETVAAQHVALYRELARSAGR